MFQKIICCLISCCLLPFSKVQAQEISLPAPGTMVHLSAALNPPILKGIKVHTDDPFKFDFVLDQKLDNETSIKLVKYFLASLTTPEKDMWVNLSPYEKDRIVPESFGTTEMGRDLLAQDYILKQITASLIYPEGDIGRAFWKKIYAASPNKNIPINTFNKVWIVPNKAVVYENVKTGTAYVVESSLKVLTEQDYLADTKNNTISNNNEVVRNIVIPQLNKEVNEGANFAQLRQVYNSLILATWYKNKIKDSILSEVYTDKNKVSGVNIENPQEKQIIYDRYLEAFKKGAYNYIKEEQDPLTQEITPRKYFSGGVTLNVSRAMTATKIMPIQSADASILSVDLIKSDTAQTSKIVEESSMDFDPSRRMLRVNGVDLHRIDHPLAQTLVFDYSHYVIKVSLDPDQVVIDESEHGISPKIWQVGNLIKDGQKYHYYIEDRIEGYNLESITSDLQQPDVFDYDFKNKISRFQRSILIADLLKKLIANNQFLEDWASRQFMLGRVASNRKQPIRAWLIDTDLLQHMDKSPDEMTQMYVDMLRSSPLNDLVVDNQLVIDVLEGKTVATAKENTQTNSDTGHLRPRIHQMPTASGGRILYSISSSDIDRIIDYPDQYFIQGSNGDTHLQGEKELWFDNDKDLKYLDGVFGLVEKIKMLKRLNPNKKVVVLDWGCGAGTGLIELYKKLKYDGVDIEAYGLSHDYYPKWQLAPKGVSFILDSGENLSHYFDKDTIGVIFSTSGLMHQFSPWDSFKRGKIKNLEAYFKELANMLLPNGFLLLDAHRYTNNRSKSFEYGFLDFKLKLGPSQDNYYVEYQKEDRAMANNAYWRQGLSDAIESTHTQLNASLEFEKRLEQMHTQLATMSFNDKDKFMDALRSFYRFVNMHSAALRPNRTLKSYSISLDKLKKQRLKVEVQLKRSNHEGNYVEIRKLSRKLLNYNRIILKLQVIVAGGNLNSATKSNFEFKRSSVLATLKGAQASTQKLQDELKFRLLRLEARKKIFDIKYDVQFDRIQKLIEQGRFIKDPQRKVQIFQEVHINIHRRLDAINVHIRKARLREALREVDILLNIYNQERLEISSNYKEIYEDLRKLRQLILSAQESLFNGEDIVDEAKKQIDTLKNKIVKQKLTINVSRTYADLGAAFRSFLHSLDGYEEEIALISKHKASLQYFAVLLERALKEGGGSISLEKRAMILEGLNDSLEWVKRGFVDPKQIAEIKLTEAITQFELQNYKGTLDQIAETMILLQQRIVRIAGKDKSWGMMKSVQQKLIVFYVQNAYSSPDFKDDAMMATPTGGIDLNANRMNLDLKATDSGIHFKTSPAMLERFKDASGFTPVIIHIQPLSNLAAFLNA